STEAPLIRRDVSEKMAEAVIQLRNSGWHEVWALVYDEFWQVLRTPSLLKLLSRALGAGYKAMPHAVVHYVHPQTGSGWSPHVDFSDRDDRFTLWFAISDAALDNGCIYAIPQDRVSTELLQKWLKMENLSHKEAKTLLQSSHALTIQAGGILAWES